MEEPAGRDAGRGALSRLDAARFFQEWASGRNYLAGIPIYDPQKEAYVRELANLGFDPPPPDATPPDMNPVNAHPPPSLLIFLPLARTTYVTAFRIWSAASIVMVALAVVLLWRELVSRPRDSWHNSRAGHPGWRRCSSLAYSNSARSSRLASRAPRSGTHATNHGDGTLGPGPVRGFWLLATLILLVSHPLREQFYNGQLNPPLLLCITGAWIALLRDRDVVAGVLLGVAAAMKLFPAFLFIVPALRRRWSTLVAGALTIVVLNLIAAAVFGVDSYRDYVQHVMPALVVMQTSAYNASLVAFWKRLFDSPGTGFLPVHAWAHWPAAAMLGLAVSGVAIVAAIVVSQVRARDREEGDLAFAAAMVGMMLLSPITWPHGFLLLLLPLVLLARRLDGGRRLVTTLTFACALFVLTARPTWWLYQFRTWNGPFMRWVPPGGLWLVTTVALQCYALVAVFVLLVAPILSRPRVSV